MSKSEDDLDVGQRTRRGVSWSFFGAVVTNVTRLAVLAVLSRALTSTDFGIVATALSANAVIYGIRDVGVGLALVQRKELDREHIATGFAISVYLGCALSAILFITAPQIARAYGVPESADVIRAMAIFFALRSVSSTSRMLAQREMAFRFITITDAVTFVSGSAVAMLTAAVGAGPWSLVAGYLVEESLASLVYVIRKPPVFAFRIHKQKFLELFRFGMGQTIIQSANIVATYSDNLIVGNQIGARGLGFYARAYDLIKMPSMMFDSIVGNVLFPAFAKLQNNAPRLAENFRRVAFVNALILMPASAALIILAPEVIRLMMGPGWDDMVLPFRILAITILLRTNLKLGGILAQAAGLVNSVAIAYVIYMVLVAGGAAISVRWGIDGVAVTTALGITVVSFHCCALAIAASKLGWRGFLAAHAPGAALTSMVVAFLLPAAEVMRASHVHPSLTFFALGGAAVLLCLTIAYVGVRRRWADFGWLSDELGRVRARRART